MKRTLHVVLFLSLAAILFSGAAQAQRIDLAFGISGMEAPGASSGFNSNHTPVSLTGGAYPGFSGDVQVFHNIGVGGEIYWKASQGSSDYIGYNYRPIFWDANAVWSPRLAHHVSAEVVGGIGSLSTRYYTGVSCNPFYGYCSTYQSSNHFDADFGGGIKFYPAGGFFVRPEARFYLINNNVDFSSNHATRYGVSIGYTFGRH